MVNKFQFFFWQKSVEIENSKNELKQTMDEVVQKSRQLQAELQNVKFETNKQTKKIKKN